MSRSDTPQPAGAPTYLFVHGSCHGAWCWRDMLAVMQARGVRAQAIDLPAHGADQTPRARVSLALFRDAVLAAIDAIEGPVVLVAHSAGGYAISAAAEARPSRIAHLAYICAYVPRSGMSLADMRRAAPRQPVLDAIDVSADRRSFAFRADKLASALYGDCTPEQIAFAAARLCPEAVAPQETPLVLSARYHSVPRSYVLCEDDKIIDPQAQAEMVADWPPAQVLRLASSHSPFFSMPARLCDWLMDLPQ